jgi:predicted nucleic acid-binding protein
MEILEPRYYLETNAVRALSRKLIVSSQSARKRLFTSFLAVSEIISGSTESDFSERRAILRNLVNAKLSVD